MRQVVTSDFKLGIVGGGQLGKMLIQAASNWDVTTHILDPDPNCSSATICTKYVNGSFRDYDAVYQFGQEVDMLTFEIEHVNVEALKKLKSEGKIVHPDPETLEIIQDKGLQKEFYQEHNIPSSAFRLHQNKEEILALVASKALTFPFVQKVRKEGYDGKGVAVIKSEKDLERLLDGASLTEDAVSIEKEIAIIVARNPQGETNCFPAVEMEFHPTANLVEKLICPSDLDPKIAAEAEALAENIINNLGMSGILAVEMFIDKEGKLWINEVAPRPHNSGHHTIESCITSQYEQHLRAIMGFPLGNTMIKLPSVMINLLGEDGYKGKVKYEGLSESFALGGVKVHIYGKKETKPFRKMGHVTVMAATVEEAKQKADTVKNTLKVKSW
ncbi:MAG: 5-(carboxyamino)imidazole ribonucleotide synthase [Flavobacteriales bacterium]|jgi:5-(carboxyamino)imidazole ribonucleotide synthase